MLINLLAWYMQIAEEYQQKRPTCSERVGHRMGHGKAKLPSELRSVIRLLGRFGQQREQTDLGGKDEESDVFCDLR